MTPQGSPVGARVSVVVLSFNRPELLRHALAAIASQTYSPTEVIVVDNRSPRSDEVAQVVALFSGVQLIANPTNQGFTGGMNTGLRTAVGEYVVLSEDDILLAPEAVGAVVRHLAENPEVGLAGGLMLNKASGTVRCAGGCVRLGGRFEMAVVGEGAADDGRYAAPFPVTYLPGAFLAGRQAVWARLRGFRQRYYLYMEDVDLCLRVVAAGLRLDVVPAARVWHFDPPVGGQSPRWLRRLKCRNLLRLYLLNAPARVLPPFLARYCGWPMFRDLVRGRRDGWDSVVTLGQTLLELPALLWERWVTGWRAWKEGPAGA
jgi:GT2 family glycosyltransferase